MGFLTKQYNSSKNNKINIYNEWPKYNNTNFWWNPEKFSGVAFRYSKAGTLITPNVIVSAWHARHRLYNRHRISFMLNNKMSTRWIVMNERLGSTDICLSLLNREVNSIRPYPLADIDWLSNMNPTDDNELVYLDKKRKTYFRKWTARYGNYVTYSYKIPGLPYKRLVGGDSGKPTFIAPDGKLILLSCHQYPNSGPNLAKNVEGIHNIILNKFKLQDRVKIVTPKYTN